VMLVTVIVIVMAVAVVVKVKVKVVLDLQMDVAKENIIAVHKLNKKKRMPFAGILFFLFL
jgi:hypothetical protein